MIFENTFLFEAFILGKVGHSHNGYAFD